MSKSISQWWGEFEIPKDAWCSWQISLLHLYINRKANEWHIAWRRDEDPLSTELSCQLKDSEAPDLDITESARFIISGTHLGFSLELALADRPVVARPDVPVSVPPGERATLFVSSGIWIQPTVSGSPLLDIPIYRPSDTWYGPNTREGELCYFSLTRARTIAQEATVYPHRATTPITVINRSDEILRIERIRVPMPLLGLYLDKGGNFVTNSTTLTLNPDAEETRMQVEDINKQNGDYQQVAPPRKVAKNGDLIETIASLFE